MEQKTIRILSFNVRYGGKGLHSAKSRAPLVIETLRAAQPDSFGLQEARWEWMEYLTAGLPEYGWVGVGREDGVRDGEFTPVFYRRDRYELVDSGNFWLSETPERPSKGWDGAFPRVCTWAALRNRETGACYAHVNTHLDHIGAQAQLEGARLVREKLLSFPMPAVCTGDFNVPEGSAVYRLLNDGPIGDAKYLAAERMSSGTYHGYHPFLARKKSPIDFIFITKESFAPQVSRVVNHRVHGRLASDHYAIYADMLQQADTK